MTHCPNGHESDAGDFCSVCGAEIAGQLAQTVSLPSPAATYLGGCPVCGTARETLQHVFCEVCGYNFRTRAADIPRPDPTTGPGPALEVAKKPLADAPSPPVSTVRWDVVVTVDPNLYGVPNPDAPTGHPAQTFTLFEAGCIVGRGGGGVRPQVPIAHDPGVSRRHAMFVRQPDGSLTVRDLCSSNGTQLNGKDLVTGVDALVRDQDVVAIGAWSRITVCEVRI